MGFKKENYTPKGLRIVYVYILSIICIQTASSQSPPHCPIHVDFEPRIDYQTRSANSVDQSSFPFFNSWSELSNLNLSDENYSTVSLNAYRRSTTFSGNNLGFSIPQNAQVTGIEILVKGHVEGEGHVEGLTVNLLDKEGNISGTNQALNALPEGKDWLKTQDSTDFIWRYGNETENWGLNLNSDLINDINFGYAIQVRNKLPYDVNVFIDQIQVIVHHIPLYTICSDHACVPFYIDSSDDPELTYEWYIPEGFELISDSENDEAINIGPSYGGFGTYEICVESFKNNQSEGICCRLFNYEDCNPGSISGKVVLDINGSFTIDNADENLSEISINLYNVNGTLVNSTVTSSQGEYSFNTVFLGQYYIQIVNADENVVFAPSGIGSSSEDNDVNGSFGPGSTGPITVNPGEEIINIDGILSQKLTVGDFIWEDSNGDGIFQDGEPGLSNVQVSLSNNQTGTISTMSINGQYSFDDIPAGEYSLMFSTPSDYEPTLANIASSELDSDNDESPISISALDGGVIDTIDAGYFQSGSIGDFVWEDLNMDGVQQNNESGLEGIELNLLDTQNNVIQSTTSDTSGFYIFQDVNPGKYTIEVIANGVYSSTTPNSGTDTTLDSDGMEINSVLTTDTIQINSGEQRTDIDFGFVILPVEITGATWWDLNNDGQFDTAEPLLPNVNVQLYSSLGDLISETTSDIGGIFSFPSETAGDYYLVFEEIEGYVFTTPNIGDDLTDSDVDGVIAGGSTEIFTLLPGEVSVSNAAGFLLLPKVGDYAWLDTNQDGIQNEDEVGINNITVHLLNEDGEVVQSTATIINPETNTSGYYLFDTIAIGNYSIQFEAIDSLNFTIPNGADAITNSDVIDSLGNTEQFALIGNQCLLDIDAGYTVQKNKISGEVWVDNNGDGIQEASDLLLENFQVKLFLLDGTEIATTTTNVDGYYQFEQLDIGNYYVLFETNTRFIVTLPLQGADPSLDSDATDFFAFGSTDVLSIDGLGDIDNVDGGLIDGAVDLNGLTWEDDNANGIVDTMEIPIEGVLVKLFNLEGELLDSTFSDINGIYTFENQLEGKYYLTFNPQDENFINTITNQGNDAQIDDDVTSEITSGSTDTIMIMFFSTIDSIGAGYYQYGTIGDFAFIDENENNINDDEPGLNNVLVNLLDTDGEIIAATTTAAGGGIDSGYYLFNNIIPGTYRIQFVRPLFYQFIAGDIGDDAFDSDVIDVSNNQGFTDFFMVTSGIVDTTRDAGFVFSVPMESSIEGIVWEDANSNGSFDTGELGVSMINIDLLDINNIVLESTSTDENGLYKFEMLIEGFYSLRADVPTDRTATLPNLGDDFIDSDFINNGTTIQTDQIFLDGTSQISNVDLGLVELVNIGNFVWEDLNANGTQEANEPGIENVNVTLSDAGGTVIASTFTDADGLYIFENFPAGNYQLCIEKPEETTVTLQDVGVEMLDNDADSSGCTSVLLIESNNLNIDFGITQNVSITGQAFVDLNGNGILNNADPGLDAVPVDLYSADGTLIESTITSTLNDTMGRYTFTNIPTGQYYIIFSYPEGYIVSPPNTGPDETDSDITNAFGPGSTDVFEVLSGQDINFLDGGQYLPACIGDFVFEDLNMDGIQDPGEPGVPNIQVVIFRSFGVPFDTVYTNEEGIYKFSGLKQGLYFIQFVVGEEYVISPSEVGNNNEVDSDADETGKTSLVSLAHGADTGVIDCGIYSSMTPTLRSVVWNDLNGDGMRQDNEPRVSDIRVTLYDDINNAIGSTLSNSLGLYAFSQIPNGDYKIFVDLEDTEYAFTSVDMSTDDMRDNDIHENGESDIFTSAQFLSVPNVDVGLYTSGGINGLVWNDSNRNGIYDYQETAIEGIQVNLYNDSDQNIKSIKTDSGTENMIFENLRPGRYYLTYDIANGFGTSTLASNVLDDNNNDVINLYGNYYISPMFTVESAGIVKNIDAGFYDKKEKEQTELVKSKEEEKTFIEGPAEVRDNKEITLEIHPNPAANYVRITVDEKSNGIIRILNAEKEVLITRNVQGVSDMHLTHLHPGVYYITLEQNGKSISKKLLKIQ